MDGLLQKGYSVNIDNFYCSIQQSVVINDSYTNFIHAKYITEKFLKQKLIKGETALSE